MMNWKIMVKGLVWQSDWNGYEVGYPDVEIVGLYSRGRENWYIDIDAMEVLEVWCDDETD